MEVHAKCKRLFRFGRQLEVVLSLLNVLERPHTAPENLGPERVVRING
jgi:hypothetical protein